MRFYIILVLLLLAACGDTAASFSYTPPPSKGGRQCVEQCSRSQGYCGESCGFDYDACFSDMQAVAARAYDRYARERFAAHLPVDKKPGDFERRADCETAKKRCQADCGAPYNACYSSCGGIVAPPDSCLLCFE